MKKINLTKSHFETIAYIAVFFIFAFAFSAMAQQGAPVATPKESLSFSAAPKSTPSVRGKNMPQKAPAVLPTTGAPVSGAPPNGVVPPNANNALNGTNVTSGTLLPPGTTALTPEQMAQLGLQNGVPGLPTGATLVRGPNGQLYYVNPSNPQAMTPWGPQNVSPLTSGMGSPMTGAAMPMQNSMATPSSPMGGMPMGGGSPFSGYRPMSSYQPTSYSNYSDPAYHGPVDLSGIIDSSNFRNNQWPTGMIYQELQCAARAIGTPVDAKLMAIANGLQKGWSALANHGLPLPSASERRQFYAQVAAESNFTHLTEGGAGSASTQRAAGGSRYKGRGPIQITFCYHYAQFARFLNDLNNGVNGQRLFLNPNNTETQYRCPNADVANSEVVQHPEALADGGNYELAAFSSIFWWEQKKAESPSFAAATQAGKNGVLAVSRGVNGGYNGLQARINAYAKIGGCMNERSGADQTAPSGPTNADPGASSTAR